MSRNQRNVTFAWWDAALDYCTANYNDSRLNERAVEIPIALEWIKGRNGDGLEVGNVLANYGPTSWRRVDRYEQDDGVENLDVFDIGGSYDWILSISTLEHVRWDEQPVEDDGALRAIAHLRGLLRPNGRMLLTVPFGWNRSLDTQILNGEIAGVARECSFRRQGSGWVQTPDLHWSRYATPSPWANSVWVGEIDALHSRR